MRDHAIAALALSTALAAVPGGAQEPTGALKRIRDAGVLNVGYAESSIPFSYYDRARNVIGYSIDICRTVVDAVKTELKRPDLKVEMRPIKIDDAASYIASGVIDIHCGPIVNTSQLRSRVDFGMTYFVLRYRFASHESATMNEIDDMQNRTMLAISGTPAMAALHALNAARNFGITVVPATNEDDAFRIFQQDGAEALVMDEVSLAQGVARNRPIDPALVMISDGSFAPQPLSLALVRGDPPLKRVVTDSMRQLLASGRIEPIYAKWFTSAIPPSGIDLGLPMSDVLRRVVKNPTDASDPSHYR